MYFAPFSLRSRQSFRRSSSSGALEISGSVSSSNYQAPGVSRICALPLNKGVLPKAFALVVANGSGVLELTVYLHCQRLSLTSKVIALEITV